jgi:uncharacterized CHY-type Zn-finger protein
VQAYFPLFVGALRSSMARVSRLVPRYSPEEVCVRTFPFVHGIDLDSQTRCAHYDKAEDIIAIKMKCCGVYYACKDCHDAIAGHPIQVWPRGEWDQAVVLCGNCGTELSIEQYMACLNRCPACEAKFNPGCRSHYHFYFDAESPVRT